MNRNPALLAALALLLAGCPREVRVPSSPEVLQGSFVGEARLWSTLQSVALAPDGSRLAVFNGGGFSLWRPDGTLLQARQPQSVLAAAFSPDGTRLAVLGEGLVLYPADGGSALRTFDVAAAFQNGGRGFLAWNPAGTRLAVVAGGEPPLAVTVDAASGTVSAPQTLPGQEPRAVALDPDENLVIADRGGTIRVIGLDGLELRSFTPRADRWQVALSPDGTRAAALLPGLDRPAFVGVFATATGQRLRVLNADLSPAWGLSIANTGAVAASEDVYLNGNGRPPTGRVRVFDPAGNVAATLDASDPMLEAVPLDGSGTLVAARSG
ncbi:MAG TPA: hypothetical protein VHN99_07620, partial [Deinococcales bacterium]|nr:hypothetical protein [Deinococcales bacterium]